MAQRQKEVNGRKGKMDCLGSVNCRAMTGREIQTTGPNTKFCNLTDYHFDPAIFTITG